jgi:hypothetical protein
MINTGLQAGAESIRDSKAVSTLSVTLTSQAVETAGGSVTLDTPA